jgi:hypothetical protein
LSAQVGLDHLVRRRFAVGGNVNVSLQLPRGAAASRRSFDLPARRVFPPAIFVVVFVVYVLTMAPTISWKNGGIDSGELVTAMYVLGIPHPTGFPVYLVLGKLFTLLPIGDVAYRVNLMSVVFGDLTVVVVVLAAYTLIRPKDQPRDRSRETAGGTLRRVRLGSGSAMPVRSTSEIDVLPWVYASLGSLVLAFTPLYWSRATIAKEYTLHLFLLSLSLWFLLQWRIGADERFLVGFALALGFGLGNHVTILAAVPGAIAFVYFVDRNLRRLASRAARAAPITLLVGSLCYAYLPIRALAWPYLNWDDPITFAAIYDHVSGSVYQNSLFHLSLSALSQRFLFSIADAPKQLGWPALVCLFVGVGILARRDRPAAVLLGSIGLVNLVFAAGYPVRDSEAYLLPAYLVSAVMISVGFSELVRELALVANRRAVVSSRQTQLAALVVAVLIPAAQLYSNWASVDVHADYFARDYGSAVLAGAEPGAVVLTNTDAQTFSLWYNQAVLGVRPDVIVIDDRLIGWPWFRAMLAHQFPDLGFPGPSPQTEQKLLKGGVPGHPVDRADTPDVAHEKSPSPVIRHVAP